MPTPARSATAAIGAPGSSMNTARAPSRITWSFRAACACRPLNGFVASPTRRSLHQNEAFRSENSRAAAGWTSTTAELRIEQSFVQMGGLIRVERATKGFAGVEVLSGLDLEVAGGEALCVLGPSGCGKTTLLRSIHGLIPLDAGRVVMDGAPVTRPRPDVAMVFQHFGLLPWRTVAANVAYGM